jgi:hypothetical protein
VRALLKTTALRQATPYHTPLILYMHTHTTHTHTHADAVELFAEMCRNPSFEDSPILLLFNKIDIFCKKIQGVDFRWTFPEFIGAYKVCARHVCVCVFVWYDARVCGTGSEVSADASSSAAYP